MSTTGGWLKDIKYIYILEYYVGTKYDEDSFSVLLWSDLPDILLSEECKVHKNVQN